MRKDYFFYGYTVKTLNLDPAEFRGMPQAEVFGVLKGKLRAEGREVEWDERDLAMAADDIVTSNADDAAVKARRELGY